MVAGLPPSAQHAKGCARINTLSTKVYYQSLTDSLEADTNKILRFKILFAASHLSAPLNPRIYVPELDALSPSRHDFSTAQSADFVALS
jgi:hypothetical protein